MDRLLDDFGPTHFGAADLGDARRTARLVQIADAIARRPQGSLPDKLHSPAALKALYRLMNHPTVTHEAVLQAHYEQTRQAIAACPGVVLLVHDPTEINLTSKRSLHPELGQLGDGKRSRGF